MTKGGYLVGLVAITLFGCGGGGGGGDPAPAGGIAVATSLQIQGVYQGNNSAGKAVDVLILEDGSWWSVYGVPSGAALLVQGVVIGKATETADKGTYYVGFTDYFAPGTSPFVGNGSGTFTGTTLNGMLTEGGASTTFNLTAPLTTVYDYNTAANLSVTTASWSGGLLNGESATVDILADGTMTATSSLGCSATGKVTPRVSGKNVFNVSLTFGAAPCTQPNQAASGVALTYPLSDGRNQLIAVLVDSSQTTATAFFAAR